MVDYSGPQSATLVKNRQEKDCAQLLGLIAGITADGHLHDVEIQFLRTWLTQKRHESDHWLYDKLSGQIDHILADGVITDEERAALMGALQDASGTDFTNTAVLLVLQLRGSKPPTARRLIPP